MSVVTSLQNPRLKALKLLASSARARRDAMQTLLDGVHLAQAYLDRVGAPQACVAAESALSHPEVAAVLQRCEKAGVTPLILAEGPYRSLSQVEQGVGVMLVIDLPSVGSPPLLSAPAVLLDNLQDPGNVGSIMRSAAAAGFKSIYCSSGTAHIWSPKVLRAAMGAHFLLDVYENVNLDELMAEAQIPVLATSSYADQTLYEKDLSGPTAWLLGHEGRGVDPALLALATGTVSIPQRPEIESLNVAAAAAVCFFEQLRQSGLTLSK